MRIRSALFTALIAVAPVAAFAGSQQMPTPADGAVARPVMASISSDGTGSETYQAPAVGMSVRLSGAAPEAPATGSQAYPERVSLESGLENLAAR